MSENQDPRDLTPEQQKLFEQAMAAADKGDKIADMIFGGIFRKIPEKKE